MPVEIHNLVEMAHQEKKRKKIFNTQRFHSWLHVYAKPGDKDDMHCHNADQSFYVIEGECTMHFPDGGAAVLTAGMAARGWARFGSFAKNDTTPSGLSLT